MAADSENGQEAGNDLEKMINRLMAGNSKLTRPQAEKMAKNALRRAAMARNGGDNDD